MMKNNILLLLVFLVIRLPVAGQDFITISGRVVDAETNMPLAFSTISIQNKPIGVVANSDGAFDFSFQEKFKNDSLAVSMNGYKVLHVSIRKEMLKESPIFKLQNAPIVLNEVVISTKKLTADDIIRLAIKNIKYNYPQQLYMLDAFYRDYKIEDEKCVGLFEAAVSIYDRGYKKSSNQLKEKIELREVRKSLDYEFKTSLFKRFNILSELLKINDVKYVIRSMDKKRSYRMARYATINDHLVYVLETTDQWNSYLYVDVENYAILKIETDFIADETNSNIWQLGDTITNDQRFTKELLEFQEIDGRYYPKYHSFHSKINVSETSTGKHLFTSELRQEYMVNHVITENVKMPKKEITMDRGLMLEQHQKSYNQEFWNRYNITKLNPLELELVKDLEKKVSLVKQFKSEGK